MTVLAAQLAAQLDTVRRPGDFFAAGEIAFSPPAIEIADIGPLGLPLAPALARHLIDAAEPAPFGRGAQTLIDPTVRRCGQFGPERMQIGGKQWAATLARMLALVAKGLGVDEPILADFYKLLVYGPGGFFVSHRDTEKTRGMFATLTIVLPSPFTGGELLIRHQGREARLDLRGHDPGEVAFAAFYADCVHEILPVTDGCRLALIYNLRRQAGPGHARTLQAPDYAKEQAGLAVWMRRWADRLAGKNVEDVPVKLVYPLEHAYTQAELGFASLKGVDAARAAVLAQAARTAGCDLHLALLTIAESGAAEYADTYDPRRHRWGTEADDFEAGEVFDRSVMLSDWRRPDGTMADLAELPVGADEIAPPDACDDLAPDEETFHEATGNEGASFERSYRRAALVLWPHAQVFAVLSQAGLAATLPYLGDLVRRWMAGEPEQRDALWQEAHALAGHMIARWPSHEAWPPHREGGEAARMLGLLTDLDDRHAIEIFLTQVIAAGFATQAVPAVLTALGRLAAPRKAALIERIIAGAAGGALRACAALLARAAAAGTTDGSCDLTGAARRLLEALPPRPSRATTSPARPSSGADVDADLVVHLLAALCAIDPMLAERATDHLLAASKIYRMDTVLIPAARRLVQDHAAQGTTAVTRLRDACLAHLQRRIAEPLAAPTDWRRDAKLPCRCRHCADLATFLSDPQARNWVLKAAEAERAHVENCLRQAGSDVDVTTERSGRPYRLVCTKNQASYERRSRQRRRDLEDVALLGG
jgi:hypothetical protein